MNIDAAVLVSSLGWALIHFLWQGLVIGLAGALLFAALRNARPQARYAVAYAALLLCLLLPAGEVWRGLTADSLPVVATPTHVAIFASAASDFSMPALEGWRPTLQDRLPWIVALWSLGAALLSLRLALGLAWVRRVGRARDADAVWQARLDRLAARLGLQGDIRLRLADDLDGPVAAGWWRPMVIVPAALVARLPPDLLEALLAHELAHIRRHDYLLNLAQSAVEALLFYHPVVWWLSRQVRIEREQIADDLAARALGAPRNLALALQELDRFQLHSSQLALAASGGNLMSRIQRLVRPNAHALTWKIALPILGLTVVCLAAYAHTQPVAPTATTVTIAAVGTAPPVQAAASALAVEPAQAAEPVDAVEPAEPGTPVDGDDARHNSYALVRAGRNDMTMSGSTRDIADVERARKRTAGDFLWFRRDGKSYLIQDPALLERARAAWRPTEPIEAQMAALDRAMEPHDQAMEALNKQMEALNRQNEPNTEAMDKLGEQMAALGREQEALGAQMEPLARQMAQADNQAAQDALNQKMQALQSQMDPLERKMEAHNQAMEAQNRQFEATQRPMEELSGKMEAASRPMEELGRKMAVLGKQEEQLSKVADRQVQALIDDALRNGRALPADGTAR